MNPRPAFFDHLFLVLSRISPSLIPARLRFAFAVQADPPAGFTNDVREHICSHELQYLRADLLAVFPHRPIADVGEFRRFPNFHPVDQAFDEEQFELGEAGREGLPVQIPRRDGAGVFTVITDDVLQFEDLEAAFAFGHNLVQRVQPSAAVELGRTGHDVNATGAVGPAAGFGMLNGIIRDVAGGDLAEFALAFDPVNHAGGHDGGVLNEFLWVFSADAEHAFGDGGTETGNNFFL